MADQEATQPFDFEVAGTAHLSRYGILVYGWYRAGTVRAGESVWIERLGDRPTTCVGAGFLCQGPPGSPDGQLLLDDQELAARITVGDRIRVWGTPPTG